MSLLPTLDEIREDFGDLEDSTERLEYLLEIGKSLPAFPGTERVERNRVLGCQSNVWMIARPAENGSGRLEFLAESDAPMVSGLVGILLAAYSGHTPREILDFSVNELFEGLKLRTFISPMRSNGLHSMVKRIQALAEEAIRNKNDAETPVVSTLISATLAAKDIAKLSADEVETIRADFPILVTYLEDGKPLVYLDNGASSQRPLAVMKAMIETEQRFYSNVHRGGHELAARTTERYEAAREAARRFIHAKERHEIVFTSGTTAGINLVARSWGDANVRAGDEILLTIMEHHSNIVPWQQLAERTGCRIRFAPINDDGELLLDEFRSMLNERTKLVAVTAVSNVLGTVNPVEQIVQAAHAAGAVVCVDAAQSAPHQAIDVQGLGADFLAFSGHKMLGPSGVGVLYGRESLLDAMPPFLGGGSMINRVTADGFTSAPLPSKFEAGTPPIVPAIGLGAAIEYLESVGLERIHLHEQSLSRRAHEVLQDIPGIRFLGPPPEKKGGIVTFVVDGIHSDDICKVLDSQGVAVRGGHHCAMPLHEHFGITASTRASFYLYNTLQEAEKLGEAVHLAAKMMRNK